MKIDEYEFSKKLYRLAAWCEPGIKYTVTYDLLAQYYTYRKAIGNYSMTLSQLRQWCSFSIKEDAIFFMRHKYPLEAINSFNMFTMAASVSDHLAELMLNPSNLVKL